jgi:ribonuclease HI
MVILKNVKTKLLYTFGSVEEAQEFQERYEAPEDLIVPEIFYCDGSGWNGTESKIAFGKDGNIIVDKYDRNITNNEAEYLAVIECIRVASKDAIIYSDSQVIVEQVHRRYKCNYDHLKVLLEKVDLVTKNLNLVWCPREFNRAGKVLEK